MVNVPQDPEKKRLVEGITKECRHQVMRIAELQADDFHLDRPLFFACRMDREVYFIGQIMFFFSVFAVIYRRAREKYSNV